MVLNDLDTAINAPNTYVAKYVDDLTIVETVSNEVRTSVDNLSLIHI